MARNEHIVIRSARAMDEDALAVLAVIDGGGQRLENIENGVLLAEVDGRVRAAVDSRGVSISDPFWPSADLVSMLRVHGGQLEERPARAPRFALRRPALA
jgi:hypothetical protein